MVQELFETALRAHQAGNLHEAARLYNQVLRADPNHASALFMFGVAHLQTGQFERAVMLFDSALRLQPNLSDAWVQRAHALQNIGRLDEAIASYDRALALAPDTIEALNGKGVALSRLGRHVDGMVCYQRVLQLQPKAIEALNNVGTALVELSRFDEAIPYYDRVLALVPQRADIWHNRGAAFYGLGRFDEAIESFNRAVAAEPRYLTAYIHRGFAYGELGRHHEAMADYAKALELEPNSVDALYGRGTSLLALGSLSDAVRDLTQVTSVRPERFDAWLNAGIALSRMSRLDEAITRFDRAVSLAPDNVDARYNRATALSAAARFEEAAADCEIVLAARPDYPYARGTMMFCRLQCCDWRELDAERARISEGLRAGAKVLNPQQNTALSYSVEDQYLCATLWAKNEAPAVAEPLWRDERYEHRRIRVAYLSADFHRHATAFLMAGLFEAHDRGRFETYAISFGPDDRSEMRSRLVAAFEHFIDVRPMSDAEVAALLREREIDIAVDLKGYTEHARTGIFAFRPAPVQLSYIGYPGTMGASYMDAIIADRIVVPAEHRPFYTERVVELPGSYQCNDPKRAISERTPSRAECRLPPDGFVFCCFNAIYKLSPEVFDVWMRLLRAVPGSVLWLIEGNSAAERNLRREAQNRGVAPERLIFAPRVSMEDHLARQRHGDLFLDTLPYNAHTTGSDALWAGVPVVTCLGTTFAGRVGASLLHAAGLPELVTTSLEDYERMALSLARDPAALSAMRERVRTARSSPLFDAVQTCRALEAAYAGLVSGLSRSAT